MPFDVAGRAQRFLCAGLIVLTLSFLLGCTEEDLKENDVSEDFAQRVEENILPEITEESETVLRTLLNFFPVLTEICATPFAELGRFQSALPAFQRAEQRAGDRMRWIDDSDDNDNRTWEVTWRNVVFGAESASGTLAPVDITLNARYLDENFLTLRHNPFNLTPPSVPQTGGTPDSFTAAGYYLFQDERTGQWTLRWHATDTIQGFAGTLSGTEFRRVMRHAEGTAEPDDLDITDETDRITFKDMASSGEDTGFTFYARPGARIRFRLNIGPDVTNLRDVTRAELLIGGGIGQGLPNALGPDDFDLSSSLPLQPTGQPTFVPGVDRGTFIWHGADNTQCTDAEDAWHVRFSAPVSTRFTGSVRVREDETDDAVLRVVAVLGSCPAVDIDANREINYACTPDTTESGYDLCVTREQRVRFDPEINGDNDPSAVFIGAANAAPPSHSPFVIRFEVDIKEQGSARQLEFDDAVFILRGNRDENKVDVERNELINPDQLSLDPNCVLLLINGEETLPRVRLTGSGEYSTDRFDGSRYELESTDIDDGSLLRDADFAFNEATTPSGLQTVNRFPDRGNIRIRTRVETAAEEVEVIAPMAAIAAVEGRVTTRIDVNITIEKVDFRFRNQPIDLGME